MTVALDVGPLRSKPAGVGVYVQSLAQGLAEIGREDIVYIGRRPDAEGLPDGVPSIARSPRIPYPAWVELRAGISVSDSGCDLVHFTDGLVPLRRPRPVVVTVLDLSLVREWRSHRVVRLARIPLVLAAPRLATRVIAISQATADEVIRLTGTAARRIDVIPLAPRASARPMPDDVVTSTLARLGLARRAFVLVPGTIEPRKNHVRVIAAFEQLIASAAIPLEMQLVIAGGPGWRSERALAAIKASPAIERIKLLGYVPEEDLWSLMASAAAVAYVSTYEGFGLPVVEAMACGAVVVTSNVSSMPEAADGEGILVDPFRSSAIAAGIQEALGADAVMRQRAVSRAGRARWSKVAEQTASVYDGLM